MLRVKTYLDKSLISNAGIGLFAAEFIPRDTIIWEYNPEHDRVYTKEEYEVSHELDKKFIDTYSFIFDGKYYLCVDNARFYNHSKDPNSYSTAYKKDYLGFTRAKRDIQVGEELTDDYSTFGLNEDDKILNDVSY